MRIPLVSGLLTGLLSWVGLVDAQAKGKILPGPFPADLNGSNFTYPYPVQVFQFQSQQQTLQMAFMNVAPTAAPNGKTAVLFHGKNFCASTWQQTIQVLTSKGWRVVAPDQVGFCKSSKPLTYQFSLSQFAWNTRGLLDALGIGNVTVIGHSLGGMLTTRYGLQYPESIDQMVIVDAVGFEDYMEKGVPYISVDDSIAQEATQTYQTIKAYEQDVYYVGQWGPTQDVQARMLANIYAGSQRNQFISCQGRIVDMVLTQPVAHYFKDLTERTLIIVGDKDKVAIGSQWSPPSVAASLGHFNVLGPQVASEIPNGSLYQFPNLGHAPQISDPNGFHAVLLSWLH